MSWIHEISYEDSTGTLRKIYDRVKGPEGVIDNVLSVHSLRPYTLQGHMTLSKSVLHNSNNSLPKWYLEALGVYVSLLNSCDYCVTHHFAGMCRLVNDDKWSNSLLEAFQNGIFQDFLENKWAQGCHYARRLTAEPGAVQRENYQILLDAGFTEGEILEVNQVVSYFNYANRTVLGLGVTTEGDVIGLSPNDSEDPTNWTHQ